MVHWMMRCITMQCKETFLMASLLACLVAPWLLGCARPPQPGCEADGKGCPREPACESNECWSRTLAETEGDPTHITLDSSFIYWTEFGAGNVMKAPKIGGDPIQIASGLDNPDAIAVSA